MFALRFELIKVVYNFTISFMTRQIYIIKLYLINLINVFILKAI